MYRDRAVVARRFQLSIPAGGTVTARRQLAAGVDSEDVYLVDAAELTIRQIRSVDSQPATTEPGCDEVSCVLDDFERACCARYQRTREWVEDADEPPPPPSRSVPTEVEMTIAGAPGAHSIVVAYNTERIGWDAAYTMTTSPVHDTALLRGALSIRNATGLAFHDARLRVVDSDHHVVPGAKTHRDPDRSPTANPHELGQLDLVEGDTRIDLLPDSRSRPLRSVLVYDPIGPGLDYSNSTPVQNPSLGVVPPPPTRVTESFELDRAPATRNLPEGPVRLFERRPDGSLVMLGEARMFGAGTLTATSDTIAVGTARGVTAHRERRDFSVDQDRKRIVEEIEVTVDNQRDVPVEVVLREHLYRGENWVIAYWSTPDIAKEGKQQVAMRVEVPARQRSTTLYVVVYSWASDRQGRAPHHPIR